MQVYSPFSSNLKHFVMQVHRHAQAVSAFTAVLIILNALIARYAYMESSYGYAMLLITVPLMLFAKNILNKKNNTI